MSYTAVTRGLGYLSVATALVAGVSAVHYRHDYPWLGIFMLEATFLAFYAYDFLLGKTLARSKARDAKRQNRPM